MSKASRMISDCQGRSDTAPKTLKKRAGDLDMEDLNVVIAGSAGEGIQTVGAVLAETVLSQGYAVFAWKEYESRIRGGQNTYSIRIGEKPCNAPLVEADILLCLNEGALAKYEPLLKDDGILLASELGWGESFTPSGALEPTISQYGPVCSYRIDQARFQESSLNPISYSNHPVCVIGMSPFHQGNDLLFKRRLYKRALAWP